MPQHRGCIKSQSITSDATLALKSFSATPSPSYLFIALAHAALSPLAVIGNNRDLMAFCEAPYKCQPHQVVPKPTSKMG
ncbi:hypothetical protein [Ferrovum myxofaciens]|uniref:Uncharacterized protein n=1 Tax=Ferrovum myxofaciens TaxID=416213 RepID=A0A9E6MYJ0_9PROT|nr:hypothetical protein [Ferrovum myxofaciens]QKE39596.1 MAG: hypothetical protein HO273_13450 [Ferrovum myxofaciens]QWY74888.1 MAG: hypothetical protein JVY19_00100 [Ferrovum myxofaciens]QWY77636.1 MAG: hypothetical protein JZL65_00665 [Ferrovum myxofaciens]